MENFGKQHSDLLEGIKKIKKEHGTVKDSRTRAICSLVEEAISNEEPHKGNLKRAPEKSKFARINLAKNNYANVNIDWNNEKRKI